MTRRYCDVCLREISNNVVSERIKESVCVRNSTVNFEIMVGVGVGNWNHGDLCKQCLFTAIECFCSRNVEKGL